MHVDFFSSSSSSCSSCSFYSFSSFPSSSSSFSFPFPSSASFLLIYFLILLLFFLFSSFFFLFCLPPFSSVLMIKFRVQTMEHCAADIFIQLFLSKNIFSFLFFFSISVSFYGGNVNISEFILLISTLAEEVKTVSKSHL